MYNLHSNSKRPEAATQQSSGVPAQQAASSSATARPHQQAEAIMEPRVEEVEDEGQLAPSGPHPMPGDAEMTGAVSTDELIRQEQSEIEQLLLRTGKPGSLRPSASRRSASFRISNHRQSLRRYSDQGASQYPRNEHSRRGLSSPSRRLCTGGITVPIWRNKSKHMCRSFALTTGRSSMPRVMKRS